MRTTTAAVVRRGELCLYAPGILQVSCRHSFSMLFDYVSLKIDRSRKEDKLLRLTVRMWAGIMNLPKMSFQAVIMLKVLVTHASSFANKALFVSLSHVGKLFVVSVQSFVTKLANGV